MLILSRKLNESIVIDGRIIVKVLRIEKDTVKLGIQAPIELSVHRQEIFEAIQRSKQANAAAEQSGNARSPNEPERPNPDTTPPTNSNSGEPGK